MLICFLTIVAKGGGGHKKEEKVKMEGRKKMGMWDK